MTNRVCAYCGDPLVRGANTTAGGWSVQKYCCQDHRERARGKHHDGYAHVYRLGRRAAWRAGEAERLEVLSRSRANELARGCS